MLAGVAPPTNKPVNVTLVITVFPAVVTKSSAVSVSSLPRLAVRERVAMRPSGFPVLNNNANHEGAHWGPSFADAFSRRVF
jgi:hypothetical protein